MQKEKAIFTLLKNVPKDGMKIEQKHLVRKRKVKDAQGKIGWQDEPYTLDYYQWASCWNELMNHFPEATYEFTHFENNGQLLDVMMYKDNSASVHCTVTIDGVSRSRWLPVMDYANKAIQNPNARDISDAKMRCLVKTIAMFGLGLSLYDGTFEMTEENKQ